MTEASSLAGRIKELGAMIGNALAPLINSDYVLLDCPYHYNIGDTLIWQGEIDFLGTLSHKCLSHSSMFTFDKSAEIPPHAVILLHGGGNFGDIWSGHTAFRRMIVESYPDNRIIILPQTVHYGSTALMAEDAAAFSRHGDLTICARDRRSYELLAGNFSNSVLMLPDMAFCIDRKKFPDVPIKRGTLYLRRNDRELPSADKLPPVPEGADVKDWPLANKCSFTGIRFYFLRGASIASGTIPFMRGLHRRICARTNRFALACFMPHAVRTGVRFIGSYEKVYTTRLHGAILAMLTDRNFTLIDNSYGKNSEFFETWLAGVDGADRQ